MWLIESFIVFQIFQVLLYKNRMFFELMMNITLRVVAYDSLHLHRNLDIQKFCNYQLDLEEFAR